MKFFEKNFDSTIIYNGWSYGSSEKNYDIIATKDNHVYFFRYKNPYRLSKGIKLPGDLENKFYSDYFEFDRTEPDTNRFFVLFPVSWDKRNISWTQINAFNIWHLEKADESAFSCYVTDGSTDTFYLITKESFKVLNYYEAESFEKCSPNVNRQNAIKTRKAFLQVFNECR